MSKTIDQRVVEMRFDNQHFEKNVATSMSTLERLKKSLNLSGASKGLENISAAAKNNNLSLMGAAAEQVGLKFSAMQIAGITAISRLTNNVVASAERMIKALTIDPVTTGFNEYELKMNSVQTIMASTGKNLETVNTYLEELNKYADQTIYSFQDMTSNIGKFTNAGVKLEDAVAAIKGVSNEAAVSGANANEASRAMYNFAQALSAGYVKLIDWKSIENANMATVEFKNELIKAAVSAGTLTKAGDGMYKTLDGNLLNATKNFNETLQDQWMTSEVLIETLKKYADETTDIGKKATQAATQVKTFSQLLDTLKEAAQSGWAKTWEIIFGDFYEARDLWTKVSNVVGGVIDKMSDARNAMLESALSSPWSKIEEQVGKAGVSVEDFRKSLMKTAKKHKLVTDEMIKSETGFSEALAEGKITKEIILETLQEYIKGAGKVSESTEDMNKKLKKFQDVVNKVWKGDFGNGKERMDALAKAGYKYAEVQELVNKTVDGHKLTLEDLSNAQLESIGYTKEEITQLRKLEKQARDTNTPLGELVEKMSRPTGRFLLLETFSNFAKELSKLTDGIKEAFSEVFGDYDMSEGLYTVIESLHELSEGFNISEENATAFKNIMEGVFSAINISWVFAAKGFMGALKVLDAVLKLFGTDILGAFEWVALRITDLNKWLGEHTLIWNQVQNVAKIIHAVIDGIYSCVKAAIDLGKGSEALEKFRQKLSEIFKIDFKLGDFNVDELVANITAFFDVLEQNIKDGNFKEFGKNIVEGLVEGITSALPKLGNIVIDMGKLLIDTFCNILGIHSPAKVFMTLGGFLVMGLAIGITDNFGTLGKTIYDFVDKMLKAFLDGIGTGLPEIVRNIGEFVGKIFDALGDLEIDFGSLFVAGTIIGALYLIKKLIDILDGLVKPVKKVNGVLDALEDTIGRLGKALSFKLKAEAIKSLAISIAILAGALVILSRLEWEEIGRGTVALLGIVASLALLAVAVHKLDIKAIGRLGLLILGLSAGMLIMSFAIKNLSDVDLADAILAIGEMTILIAAIAGLFRIYGESMKGANHKSIKQSGKLLIRMGIALGLMAIVIKIVSGMSVSDILKGLGVMAGFTLLIGSLVLLSKFGFGLKGASKVIAKVGTTMLIMAIVLKIIATMSYDDIIKGLLTLGGFTLIIGALVKISKQLITSRTEIVKAGTVMLQMSVAIGLMAMTLKLLSTISAEDTIVGMAAIAGFMFMSKMFVEAIRFIDNANLGKAGLALIGMGVAMSLMAISIKILSGMSLGDILKGITALSLMTVLVGAMTLISRLYNPLAGTMGKTLIGMSVSILILSGCVALLSMLDPKKVLVGTAAIAALMACFSLMTLAASKLQDTKNTMKTLITMAGIIAAYVGIVALLSFLDPKSVMTNTSALSMLMSTFAVSLNIISKSSRVLPTVKSAIPMLLGVTLGLTAMIATLSMCDPEGALAGASALSILLLSYTASLKILSQGGRVSKTVSAQMGPLLAVTLGLAAIVAVLGVIPMDGVLEKASALSMLLISFSVAVGILGTIGKVASKGIDFGIVALGKLVLAVGALSLVLGAIEKLTDGGLGNVLDKGTDIIIKIGEFIGGFVGGIVGGFAKGATDSLPDIGQNLSDFMVNASYFIEGMKGIDESTAAGAKSLAQAILYLTGANILDSMTSWLTGGTSMADFGSELGELGAGIKSFADNTAGIDASGIEPAMKVFESITKIADKIPNTGGLAALFAGDNSIGSFASQLPEVGTHLKDFATNLGTFSDGQVAAIECGIKALKAMVKAGEGIDGQSAIGKSLFGDNGIASFADQLPSVGLTLKAFVTNLGTFTDAQVTTIDCAVKAIKSMIKASEGIDGQSEWGKALFGDNGLGAFSDQLPKVGSDLSSFANNLGTFTEGQVTTIKCAADAIKAMAEAGANIDGQSGWAAALFGDNSIGAFSEQLPSVGTCLKDFAANLGTFGEEKLATVNIVVKVVKALAELGGVNLATVNTYLPTFGEKIKAFASDLKSFCTEMADVESGGISATLSDLITSIANTATKIEEMKGKFESAGKSIIKGLKSGITDSSDSITKACETLADDGKKAIEDKKDKFKSAGKTLISSMKSALSEDTIFVKAAKTLAQNGADGAADKASAFESTGKDLGDGLVAGIKAKYDAAYNAGFTLGQKAVQGEKDGQASNSPSKETIKAGKWLGEGLIVGIDRISTKVYKSGYELGRDATNSISSAVSRMSDAISTDIDSQPTIRPVLDLSDIQSGAKSLNGIFDNPNIVAVSSMMSRRGQNGANGDVIDAINKLGKKLGNVGNTSYNINGVDISDNAEVADAFRVIARAIKVEGRA